MASYWVDRGYDVSVVTLVNTRADFHRLPPGVTRILLPESDWPLVRTRRFLVRLFEGRELVTDSFRNGGERSPSGAGASGGAAEAGDRAPGGRRRLDGLREAYIFLLGVRDRIFGYIARHRLLGSSGAVYARVLRAVEWKVEALRGVLQRAAPDAVLSVLGATNIISTAASAGLPHRTVISERNDPSRQRLDAPWHDLRPLIYGQADAVSANSRGALEAMRAYCPPEKLCLAPNPLVLPDAVVGAARSDAVLFLARLVPQKAPDVLIEAFARLHSRRPSGRSTSPGTDRWRSRCGRAYRRSVWPGPSPSTASSRIRPRCWSVAPSSCCRRGSRGPRTRCWRPWRIAWPASCPTPRRGPCG